MSYAVTSLGRDDRPPTAAEWHAFETGHYAGFNDWLQQVADHRGLSFAEMETRAYGRVFTGREALDLDLIDSLGNLDQAIATAVRLAEDTLNALPFVLGTPAVSVWTETLNASDITLRMTAWIDQRETDLLAARSEAIRQRGPPTGSRYRAVFDTRMSSLNS